MNMPEGWPTDDMTQAGFAAFPDGFNRIGYDVLRSVFKAMIAAAPAPPGVEPVGYMNPSGRMLRPVFSAPPSELVKAAEEAVRLLAELSSDVGFETNEEYAILRNLRAALDKVKS